MTSDSWRQLEDMHGQAGRIITQARVWSRLQGLLQRLFPDLFDAGARLARIRGATVVVMVERAEHAVLVRYRQGEILQALQVMWPQPLEKLTVWVSGQPAHGQSAVNTNETSWRARTDVAREHLDALGALLTRYGKG